MDIRRPVTILYAEDDLEDQLLLRDAIRECGLTVDLQFVPTGEALLDTLAERLERSGPREVRSGVVVFLDLNLPGMGGLEALRRMRHQPETRLVPVVILSSSTADEEIHRALDAGANSYLAKPSTYGEMIDTMAVAVPYWTGVARF